MRILIAEDDRVSRFVLEAKLKSWGYEVSVAVEDREALSILQGESAPALAILDWMMPVMDGVNVTREIRKGQLHTQPYIILLTAKSEKADIITALEAGADDYLTKPFDAGELRARLQVGVRIVGLQRGLSARVVELEDALSNIKQLEGMLPICSYCKKIRGDTNYWQKVEDYISEHSRARFSHGICPDCYGSVVKPQLEELRRPPASLEKGI